MKFAPAGPKSATMAPMANITWRQRLEQAITKSGMSERAISRAIGRAPGYTQGIIKLGKEPSIESVVRLADVLGVSLEWLLFGIEQDGDTDRLMRIYAGLSPDQRAEFLRLAESVAALAGRTEP